MWLKDGRDLTTVVDLLENDAGRPLLDLGRREWQEVAIPISQLNLFGTLASIQFSGGMSGTFLLDDIRLVRDSSFGPTAVLESHTSVEPQSFALSQNYPNPFNSGTVIPFDLETAGEVELAVYNLAGQKVATLVEGYRNAGKYRVAWDGRDGDGEELATGLYLYRLRTAGQAVQTRKLLLLR